MKRGQIMQKAFKSLLVLFLSTVPFASPAFAELKLGSKAPEFALKVATNGKVSNFTLSSALKNGPVVVYFYPKAFTSGCSLEARQFSQSMPRFKAKHITVIGISGDRLNVLKDFSKKECAGQFSVASDRDLKVSSKYEAKMSNIPMAARVSYLIGQDGKILFSHTDSNAATHVSAILEEIDKLP